MWKRLNRRPPKQHSGYWNIAIGWIVVGFYGGFGSVAMTAAVKESSLAALLIGLGFLGLILFQSYINIAFDKRVGRMDALDKSEMEHWKEKATRLGMNTETEEKAQIKS
jgi:hypothetical protein